MHHFNQIGPPHLPKPRFQTSVQCPSVTGISLIYSEAKQLSLDGIIMPAYHKLRSNSVRWFQAWSIIDSSIMTGMIQRNLCIEGTSASKQLSLVEMEEPVLKR
jgi:hypothetical protein